VKDCVEVMGEAEKERPLVRRNTTHSNRKRKGQYRLNDPKDCAELGVECRGKVPTGNPVIARMGRPDTWRR
jgi:hypothetical protein